MAKVGRHKKEILEAEDLADWKKLQETIRINVEWIGEENLNPAQRQFVDLLRVNPDDDIYEQTIKALRFKHDILHKCLTQEECTYFIDVDDKGTKPSREKRMSKMGICKIEMRACAKLKEQFGKKFNAFKLSDVMDVNRNNDRFAPVDMEHRWEND